jgi:hypothetical protein
VTAQPTSSTATASRIGIRQLAGNIGAEVSGLEAGGPHYAIFGYGSAHRRGERVTVAGPVPVGVDGRPSVALTGEASAYYAGAASA